MAISKHKKRYQISLTVANFDRFQSLADEMGMPPGTLSKALDDCVKDLSDLFQTAKDQGSLTLSDLQRLMGKQMDLAIEIDKKGGFNNEVQQKRPAVAHSVKSS